MKNRTITIPAGNQDNNIYVVYRDLLMPIPIETALEIFGFSPTQKAHQPFERLLNAYRARSRPKPLIACKTFDELKEWFKNEEARLRSSPAFWTQRIGRAKRSDSSPVAIDEDAVERANRSTGQ